MLYGCDANKNDNPEAHDEYEELGIIKEIKEEKTKV